MQSHPYHRIPAGDVSNKVVHTEGKQDEVEIRQTTKIRLSLFIIFSNTFTVVAETSLENKASVAGAALK